MQTKKGRNSLLTLLIFLVILGFNFYRDRQSGSNHSNNDSRTSQVTKQAQEADQGKTITDSGKSGEKPYDQKTYDELAQLDFKSGDYAVKTVNHNQSTVNLSEWQTSHAVYGNLDQLNRTTFVTAYVDKSNLGKSEGRDPQRWQPTGWHQKFIDGQPIYNRGHLLAYTSSFNLDMDGNFKRGEQGSIDNPKNLGTQSAFSNQQVQTTFETDVRNAQKLNGNKVIYQIVTVFRGAEKMPRGYWLQAKDSKGTLNFNVYEFNVQPGVQFDYATGASKVDRGLKVKWNDQTY